MVAAILLIGTGIADATVYVWKQPSGLMVITNDRSELPDEGTGQVTTYEMAPLEAASLSEGRGTTDEKNDGERRGRGAATSESRSSESRAPERRASPTKSTEATKPWEEHPSPGAATAEGPEQGEPAVSDSTLALYSLLREPVRREPPPFLVSVVGSSSRPLSTSGEIGSTNDSSRTNAGSPDRRASRTSGLGTFDRTSSRNSALGTFTPSTGSPGMPP